VPQPPQPEIFRQLEQRARICAAKRNQVLHAEWHINPDFKGAKTYFVTRKGQRLKGDYRDVEEADLINIANEIERCREEFTDFLKSTFPEYERFRKP